MTAAHVGQKNKLKIWITIDYVNGNVNNLFNGMKLPLEFHEEFCELKYFSLSDNDTIDINIFSSYDLKNLEKYAKIYFNNFKIKEKDFLFCSYIGECYAEFYDEVNYCLWKLQS